MGKGLFPIQLLVKLHITSILRTCHARNLGKAYSISYSKYERKCKSLEDHLKTPYIPKSKLLLTKFPFESKSFSPFIDML